MSSFGTAFLQTTADAANKKFSEKVAQDQKVKDEQRQMYWKIAYDTRTPEQGGYTEIQRQSAKENLDKLLPPSLRKNSQKFNQIFGTLSQAAKAHAASQQGQPPAPQPQTGAQPSPAGKLTGPSTPAPVSSGAPPSTPQTAAPQAGAQPATPKPSPSTATQLQGPKTPPPQPQQRAQGGVPIMTSADRNAMLDADSQAQYARQSKIDDEERERRSKIAKENNLTGMAAAEFIEKGTFPAAAFKESPEDVLTAQIKDANPELSPEEAKQQAAQILVDAAKKKSTATKSNMQQEWFHYPGEDENAPAHSVRVDPKDPSIRIDADTGKPAPDGAVQVNPAIAAAKIRQDSYGTFGNLYRTFLGKGYTDDQARKAAGDLVYDKYQLDLSNEEQNIGIKQSLSGVGGAPARTSSATPPQQQGAASSSTSTPATAPPGTTPAKPATATAVPITIPANAPPSVKSPPKSKTGALTPEDNKYVDVFLGRLFGNLPSGGGPAGQVGAQKGMEILAQRAGVTPAQFQSYLAVDKDKVKAMADTVQRYSAVQRLNEVLGLFSDNMVDNAKKIQQTGSPFLNQKWREIKLASVGDPKIREYVLSLNAMQRQYSVLTAGGALSRAMLPVSTSEKVDDLLSPNETLAEAIASVSQIKKEAQLEQQGFKKSIDDISGEIRDGVIGKASASPNAQKAMGSGPQTSAPGDSDSTVQKLLDKYK